MTKGEKVIILKNAGIFFISYKLFGKERENAPFLFLGMFLITSIYEIHESRQLRKKEYVNG